MRAREVRARFCGGSRLRCEEEEGGRGMGCSRKFTKRMRKMAVEMRVASRVGRRRRGLRGRIKIDMLSWQSGCCNRDFKIRESGLCQD